MVKVPKWKTEAAKTADACPSATASWKCSICGPGEGPRRAGPAGRARDGGGGTNRFMSQDYPQDYQDYQDYPGERQRVSPPASGRSWSLTCSVFSVPSEVDAVVLDALRRSPSITPG